MHRRRAAASAGATAALLAHHAGEQRAATGGSARRRVGIGTHGHGPHRQVRAGQRLDRRRTSRRRPLTGSVPSTTSHGSRPSAARARKPSATRWWKASPSASSRSSGVPPAVAGPTADGQSTRTVRSGRSPPVAQSTSRSSSCAVEAPAVPLVGDGRRRVAVGDHPLARRPAPARAPRPRARPGRPPSAAPRPVADGGGGRGRAAARAATPRPASPRARRSDAAPRALGQQARPGWTCRSRRCPRARSGDPGPASQNGRRSPWRPSRRPAAFLAAPLFLAAAFFAAGLLGRCLLGRRLLLGRCLLGLAAFFLRVEGPAARRSASSSDGPLDGDRLHVVALAQRGVGGAVGHVGPEAARP